MATHPVDSRSPVDHLEPSRGPCHLHHARGGGRVRAARPALQRGQGLRRPAPAGREGLPSGEPALPHPPRGHRAQLPEVSSSVTAGSPSLVNACSWPRSRSRSIPGRVADPGEGGMRNRLQTTALLDAIASTTSTPASVGPGGTRTRPGQGSVSCPSATPSASGTPSANDPSSGSSTRAGAAGREPAGLPLSDWTELDIWQYIARESIELPRSTSPTGGPWSSGTACCWRSPSGSRRPRTRS